MMMTLTQKKPTKTKTEGVRVDRIRSTRTRTTRAIINLKNIQANFLFAQRCAPHSKTMAIIKADAYGHGLLPVAKALQGRAAAFGVAIFNEAVLLRDSGIKNNILILQGVFCKQELEYASEHDLWITLHSKEQVDLLLATPLKKKIKIWLKIDTGMHRLGLDQHELENGLKSLRQCSWVDKKLVISSHFSCANELKTAENSRQLIQFNQMLKSAHGALQAFPDYALSLSNSPAIVNMSQAHFDWIRPGVMLYGLPLFDSNDESDQRLKAAMTFESEIISVKQIKRGEAVGYGKKWLAKRSSTIATVSVGYADGYPRQAENGTPILVHGQEAKLVGAVSMDLITIDVTDIANISVGDVVELWGNNLSVNQVARHSDSIGYDLIAGIMARVPRVYLS